MCKALPCDAHAACSRSSLAAQVLVGGGGLLLWGHVMEVALSPLQAYLATDRVRSRQMCLMLPGCSAAAAFLRAEGWRPHRSQHAAQRNAVMACVLLCETFPDAAQELAAVGGARLLTDLPAGLWAAREQEAVVQRLRAILVLVMPAASPQAALATPPQRAAARAARPPPPAARQGSEPTASPAAAGQQQGSEAGSSAAAASAAAPRRLKLCSACGATRAIDGSRLKKCRGCLRTR